MKLDKNHTPHFTADVMSIGGALKLYVPDEAAEGGFALSAVTRQQLLTALRSGEFTGPLLVEATTFIQRPTPNRNYSRFARGTLRAGARSFVGQVVLLDHDQRSQQARIGTIVKSVADKDAEGNVTFVMTLSIVKQHAIESVLDGTIDRFSIGWFPTGTIACSVHEQPLFGPGCCTCWPGDTVNGKKVEAVFTSWEGVEVSAVNVPAVVGTGIDQIRAALTALRSDDNIGGKTATTQKKETTMNIRSYLGLADTATDDEVQAALTAKDAAMTVLKTQVAEQQALAASNEAQLAAARAARIDTSIAAAYADGRLAVVRDSSGKQIASELETRIRSVASASADSAIALLDALPKMHPNGNPAALQSNLPAAPVVTPATQTSSQLDNMLPLMGLDADDVKQFGPQNRQLSAKGAPVPRHLSKLFATRHINFTPAK